MSVMQLGTCSICNCTGVRVWDREYYEDGEKKVHLVCDPCIKEENDQIHKDLMDNGFFDPLKMDFGDFREDGTESYNVAGD